MDDLENGITLLIFYILGSNVIVVISLNILISIVTDKYDNVLMKLRAIDMKHQAQIMLEQEIFLFWNRQKVSYGHLFILRYKESGGGDSGMGGEDAGGNSGASGEWQGKMREMKLQIYAVQEILSRRVLGIEKKVQGIEMEVQKVKDDVKSQVDSLSQGISKIMAILKKVKKQ